MAPPCKLTEDDVYNIKAMLFEGYRLQTIADLYEINESMVSKIKNEHFWEHVKFDVDFVKYKNFWSHRSPELAAKIVDYYLDGYTQEKVAELMNEYISTIDEKIRPGNILQCNVNFILKQEKVKLRRGTGRYGRLWETMKKMKKQGYRNKEIALELNVPPSTVSRYLNKKRK